MWRERREHHRRQKIYGELFTASDHPFGQIDDHKHNIVVFTNSSKVDIFPPKMLLRFSFFSTARFHSIINILIVFLQIFSLLLLGELPFHFPPNHMLYISSYPAMWERVSRLIRDKVVSRTKTYNYRHSEPSSSSFNLCARALAKFTVSAKQISSRKRWNFPDKDKNEKFDYISHLSWSFIAKIRVSLLSRKQHH